MNYYKETEKVFAELKTDREPLLLHSCCAVCSSSVIELLARHFQVTVFYCNPNIMPEKEYLHRKSEQIRLLETVYPAVPFVDADYDNSAFLAAVRGLEALPEGGERCAVCFRLRLERTADYAARHGFRWFATTLSVSPRKNAAVLNEIGQSLALQYPVRWLPADFKKKNGYGRSVALAEEYDLYRQNYCGCVFSQRKDIP